MNSLKVKLLILLSVFFLSSYAKICTNKIKKDNRSELEPLPFQSNFDWDVMYQKIKFFEARFELRSSFLKEVSLHDVRLDLSSLHGKAQETNLRYLLLLDVDNLVWSFRKTAGLSAPGHPYGGWEAPNVELRGHFVGHYLSASAKMWASTHNSHLKDKMDALVSALDECQQKMGTGYLSAFPTEEFDLTEALQPVWAPYYTIHKIMAGLLDQYTYADNNEALRMVVWMANYFSNRVQTVISNYTVERHWLSLNEETGGMNEVMYRLYGITGDQKYLVLGTLFDKPCFIGMLALQDDSLSDFHANTHIPIVIGTQLRYELTGDPLYKAIGSYFMDIVNSSHCYATGGTSKNEFWSDPKRLATTLHTDNEESCATYNMLKVSRHLFRWTKDMIYADYYERALTNGVLSIQRGEEPGVMIYFLPLGRGVSKAISKQGWGTQFNSFWCCYGTGIESFSKLGDSIYYEEESQEGLYIVQFISSIFNWKSGGLIISQKVEAANSWDRVLRISFDLTAIRETDKVTMNVRIPLWTGSIGAQGKLNGEYISLPAPGTFLSIKRKWNSGDSLILEMPMRLWTETIKDDRPQFSSIKAILYGPYLLAGLSNGDWDIKTGAHNSSPSEWMAAVPATHSTQLISLSQTFSNRTFVLMNRNSTITMETLPEPGTNSAVHATFRVVCDDADSTNLSSRAELVGKSVRLEPFDLPGTVVVQQGPNKHLLVSNAERTTVSSLFYIVEALDGDGGSISLESKIQKGCFLYSGVDYSAGLNTKISCQPESTDVKFQQAASFRLGKGLSEYHNISFVVHGSNRNFLLMPLLCLRDEHYTVYFNMGT